MNKIPKSILAIAFIILAGLPAGFSMYFLAWQAMIRQRMKEELVTQQLHTLLLEKKDVRWVEEGRELLIGYHMFDVEEMTLTNDGRLEVKGLYDIEEDNLHIQLRHSLHNEKTQQANTVFPAIFYQLIFELSEMNPFSFKNFVPSLAYRAFYSEYFPFVFLPVRFQPPKA